MVIYNIRIVTDKKLYLKFLIYALIITIKSLQFMPSLRDCCKEILRSLNTREELVFKSIKIAFIYQVSLAVNSIQLINEGDLFLQRNDRIGLSIHLFFG